MTNETEDIVYRCKDCSKYNLCYYYHRRKETSQICHYFELPERKAGKWEVKYTGANRILFWHCSCCDWLNLNWTPHNYCPNCGAKMVVERG